VLECNPYSGPFEVYAEKVLGDVKKETPAMRIGKVLEPEIARMFSEQTQIDVYDPGEFEIAMHPDIPWLGATLDRVTEVGNHPVELKSVQSPGIDPTKWSTHPPEHYQVQLQIQMQCTGADRGYLVGLFPRYRLEIYEAERDDEFFKHALTELREFWFRVQRKDAPPATGAKMLDVVKRLYKSTDEKRISFNEEYESIVKKLQNLKSYAKDIETKIKEHEVMIRDYMKDAVYGDLSDGSAIALSTVKNNGGTRVIKPYEYRPLRFIKTKGEKNE
jgi:putative phage-type endonuclease